MILSIFAMNKTVINTVSLNRSTSALSDLYPIIFTLIVLIVLSGVIKIIQTKNTTK